MIKKILIISPLKKKFDSVRQILKTFGYTFSFARDLENAQLYLIRRTFSLTIVDLDYFQQHTFFDIISNMSQIAPFQFILITNRKLNIKDYNGLRVIMQGPINNHQLATHIIALA